MFSNYEGSSGEYWELESGINLGAGEVELNPSGTLPDFAAGDRDGVYNFHVPSNLYAPLLGDSSRVEPAVVGVYEDPPSGVFQFSAGQGSAGNLAVIAGFGRIVCVAPADASTYPRQPTPVHIRAEHGGESAAAFSADHIRQSAEAFLTVTLSAWRRGPAGTTLTEPEELLSLTLSAPDGVAGVVAENLSVDYAPSGIVAATLRANFPSDAPTQLTLTLRATPPLGRPTEFPITINLPPVRVGSAGELSAPENQSPFPSGKTRPALRSGGTRVKGKRRNGRYN